MEKIRLALVDDHLLFRKGMVSLLRDHNDIELVLEASDGQELMDALQQGKANPDVVLMDINMSGMNGIETTRRLRSEFPEAKILVLSVHCEEHFIVRMIELGAHGYLFKNSEPSELIEAICTVMRTGFYFNDTVLLAMRKGLMNKKQREAVEQSTSLTVREKEILQLICKEFTASEIGEKLFISARTVDGHRNNLLEKTGSRNTAGLVVFALKHQLVRLDE
jgi:DNA-binding NarL/FixJ family response regulator